MAPDTPRRHLHAVPRYADIVPDGLTQIRKHPEPEPRPPTERGWWADPAWSDLGSPDFIDPEVDPHAVDLTFENETRPHR